MQSNYQAVSLCAWAAFCLLPRSNIAHRVAWNESTVAGWEYKGELVNGVTKPCQDGDYDLGAVWECPFLTRLPQVDGNSSSAAVWMLCVSPYPHFRDDRPTNPCLYWLGSFDDEHFMLGNAAGKLRRCFWGQSVKQRCSIDCFML